MKSSYIEPFFEHVLFSIIGKETNILDYTMVQGGCINICAKVVTDDGFYFVKWNEEEANDRMEKEAEGLEYLAKKCSLRIPEVYSIGKYEGKNYLVLEFIQSLSLPTDGFWKKFGNQLAQMHQQTHGSYGFFSDNYIGSLAQKNDFSHNGVDFFIENRLKPQVGLAFYQGLIAKDWLDKMEKFYPKLHDLLPSAPSSLLHGDLWSGNFLADEHEAPVLVDPAVYYGNREAEMAFTFLFGGFHQSFYDSYQETWPLDPGFAARVELYNLYPLFVHVNLFGNSYLKGIEKVLTKYV